MKKRILCALLTLIMVLSLVPATAITASAAANAASENAITVLKKLEVYTKKCDGSLGGNAGYIGYGLPCGGDHSDGLHVTDETKANTALREEVKKLDTAINSFAAANGISLSQGQHDALVLFCYDNGTAWMNGTGDYKSAVVSGVKGNAFLNAVVNWHSSDSNERRLIEANMYLKGQYSSAAPSSFKSVTLEVNGGSMVDNKLYYYDASSPIAIPQKPTKSGNTFRGWYSAASGGKWITTLNSDTPAVLYAQWQSTSSPASASVDYKMHVSRFASLKARDQANDEAKTNGKSLKADTTVQVAKDYVDKNGAKWCYVSGTGWFKVGTVQTGSASTGTAADVTVTVTNTYVRSRKENNIYSAQNGTYYQGQQLRIINVATSKHDTFTWGQVAKSASDSTPVGWVALIYTDYDSVAGKQETQVSNGSVVAKATVTVNGYVNVRSGAGLNNGIVGALPQNTTVELYETRFVNGHEWGRCTTGWFCLDYAKVTRLVKDTTSTTDSNVVSYALNYKPSSDFTVYKAAGSSSACDWKIPANKNAVISNLTQKTSGIWGKAYWLVDTDGKDGVDTLRTGWLKLSDITWKKDEIKFSVAIDELSVRDSAAGPENPLKDKLSKGTEIWVKDYSLTGDSVWGYVWDTNTDQYVGWIELTGSNVTRLNAPKIPAAPNSASIAGKIATVVNTDSVNVRVSAGVSYKKIGTLAGNTTVAVWEENDGWYKVDSNGNGTYDYEGDGWVSGTYLNVRDGVIENGTASGGTTGTVTSETGLGIVSNTYTGVNVRSNPGTGSALLGKLLAGTTVEIYETTTHGASKWGRTDEGWVCMDYITMIGDLPADILAGLGGGAGSSTTVSSSIYTGNATAAVAVRREAKDDAEVIRNLASGDPITLHEIVVITTKEPVTTSNSDGDEVVTSYVERTANWARVNDGWIKAPEQYIALDTLNEITYTVTGNDTLNVRVSAGIENALVDKAQLSKGDQVVITKLDIAKDGTVWGYIEAKGGWASLAYMTEGALTLNQIPSTDTGSNGNTSTGPDLGNTGNTGNAGTDGFVNNAGGYRYTGKVIRTNSLNVRSTPSQTATKTTTLTSGQALVIYETTIAENMAWGRCDAGWVYLYYVDLVPCNTAVDAKVVYTEGTIAYTDASCSAVAGTYTRMSVVDIYEVVGTMARTELGWVHTDNLG